GIEPAADRVGVARYSGLFRESFPLRRASALDAGANRCRWVAVSFRAQITKSYRSDCDTHVDSVGKRTGYPRVVALDIGRAAIAGARRVGCPSARTRVRRADESEPRRVGDCLFGTGNDYLGIFHP